ncbi:MAG: hypothetical protein JO146_07230, partial [Candidatus Eremiobacteraeota bacterium]|nr:hypothetical protein [Candidatus Eremiobacteraeota bacterium]
MNALLSSNAVRLSVAWGLLAAMLAGCGGGGGTPLALPHTGGATRPIDTAASE